MKIIFTIFIFLQTFLYADYEWVRQEGLSLNLSIVPLEKDEKIINYLSFEVTESQMIQNQNQSISILNELS